MRRIGMAGRGNDAAGNFYINDKAGSFLNLIRWTSARTIKETFDPPRDYRYAFLGRDEQRG